MKTKLSVLFLGLVVCLCAFNSLAQGEEQKEQLLLIEDVIVQPYMAGKYEAYVKEWIELAKKHNVPLGFETANTEDFHYYFIVPAEDITLYNTIQKLMGEFMAKMGDTASRALMKSAEGTYESVRWTYYRHRPDLSYNPEKPRLKPGEATYWYLIFDYVIPGKEAEYESVLKKILSLGKRMSIEIICDTFIGEMGTDTPLYVISFSGKTIGEFWANYEKEATRMGAEYNNLVEQLIMQTRKREIKFEWARPDLSYTPQK